MSAVKRTRANEQLEADDREYVIMMVAGQQVGMPVEQVQDVLRARAITPIPLAPPEVAGLLNLRGRIVTVIDMRVRLGLPPYHDSSLCMSVVSIHQGQLYCFLVDNVSDVLHVDMNKCEKCPPNLGGRWLEVASHVYRYEQELLVLMDMERIVKQ
jgi:purine-binding chemotaxis protein CheW